MNHRICDGTTKTMSKRNIDYICCTFNWSIVFHLTLFYADIPSRHLIVQRQKMGTAEQCVKSIRFEQSSHCFVVFTADFEQGNAD